jgi:hypothetical protein
VDRYCAGIPSLLRTGKTVDKIRVMCMCACAEKHNSRKIRDLEGMKMRVHASVV